jgi:hypothetical protein
VTYLVFVVGSLHSGANWVHELLSGHPLVTGIRDPWTLYDERQTVERVRAAGDALSNGAGTDVVALRSVPSVLMIRELAEAWPNARFVHVLRDGREAVVRIRMSRYPLDERTARLFGNSISSAAAGWARAVDAGLDAELQLGDRMKTVRFEQVLQDRRRAAGELLDYVGLYADDMLISEILERDGGRLNKPEPQDSWQAYFSVYRALKFDRAAGETLRRAGYERDPKWWWRPIKR